eukprot:1913579-Prymnesium_polylepis.1
MDGAGHAEVIGLVEGVLKVLPLVERLRLERGAPVRPDALDDVRERADDAPAHSVADANVELGGLQPALGHRHLVCPAPAGHHAARAVPAHRDGGHDASLRPGICQPTPSQHESGE